jgi:hypothetical protein
VGYPSFVVLCVGGMACLASDRVRGQEPGRAEITGSREGAKPRSSDEKRTFLPKSHLGPRLCSRSQAKAIRGHGQCSSGGPHARMQACARGQGPVGLVSGGACIRIGRFSGTS